MGTWDRSLFRGCQTFPQLWPEPASFAFTVAQLRIRHEQNQQIPSDRSRLLDGQVNPRQIDVS